MNNKLVYAYFAGAIDADGFITIGRLKRTVGKRYGSHPIYYIAKMGFIGTSGRKVHDLLKKHFGGSIYSYTPKNKNHKKTETWYADGKNAEKALVAIMPYLRYKGKQAVMALKLIRMIRSDWIKIKKTQKPPYRVPAALSKKRHALWEKVTRLNAPRNRRKHFLETA